MSSEQIQESSPETNLSDLENDYNQLVVKIDSIKTVNEMIRSLKDMGIEIKIPSSAKRV